MNLEKLRNELRLDEGVRNSVYVCTGGANTVGVGHNIDANGFPDWLLEELNLTYSMLRDPDVLATIRLNESQIERLLDNDIMISIDELNNSLSFFRASPDAVQRGLVNMCFNMGITKLRRFKKMLQALSEENYTRAEEEAIDSRWYREVRERGTRVSALIGNKEYDGSYA